MIDFVIDLSIITRPNPMVYAQVSGLFLLVMGYLLIYASKDIEKYAIIGFGSFIVRYSFAIIILLDLIFNSVSLFFLLIAIGDLITGTLLFVTFFDSRINKKAFFILFTKVKEKRELE